MFAGRRARVEVTLYLRRGVCRSGGEESCVECVCVCLCVLLSTPEVYLQVSLRSQTDVRRRGKFLMTEEQIPGCKFAEKRVLSSIM